MCGRECPQLESFPAPSQSMVIDVQGAEFTCLRPVTREPDFAVIRIRYKSRERCIESRSLAVYLASFRDVEMSHEAVVAKVAKDLNVLLNPFFLKVIGEFAPTDGIMITPKESLYGMENTQGEKEDIEDTDGFGFKSMPIS